MAERTQEISKHMIKSVYLINKASKTYKNDAEFCKTIGMKQQFLVSIRAGDKLISPCYVLKLSELHGIHPTNLRPDIYPEWLFNKQA